MIKKRKSEELAVTSSKTVQWDHRMPLQNPQVQVPELDVLSEDDYHSLLSVVVQRQYFPDLPILRLQKEIEDARWSNDSIRKAFLERKLNALLLAEEELDGLSDDGGTDDRITVTLVSGRKKELNLRHLTIDDFQQRFSHDDIATLKRLLSIEREKKDVEQKILFDAMEKHNQRRLDMLERFDKGEEMSNALIPSMGETKNSLMFHPGHWGSRTREGDVVPCNSRLPRGFEEIEAQDVRSKMLSNRDAVEEENAALGRKRMLSTGEFTGSSMMETPKLTPETTTPLFTWGTLGSTPVIINDLNDTPEVRKSEPPSFEVPALTDKQIVKEKLLAANARNTREKRLRRRTPKELLTYLTGGNVPSEKRRQLASEAQKSPLICRVLKNRRQSDEWGLRSSRSSSGRSGRSSRSSIG